MKNKKVKLVILIIFLLTLLFGLIGVTFSYFNSESQLTNEFNAGKYKTTASEQFVSPTNWKPGDITPKTLIVKNEGDIDMYVRVSISESWKNKNGEDLPLEQNGNRVSIINFDNQSDWTKRGNYYYYNNVLEPNDETSSLIQSVTFNPDVVGDYTCSQVGNKTTCTSTGDSYEGGTYTLTFNIETIQSDAYNSMWNPYEYVNRQVAGEITTGDEIRIGTEYFYVVSSDSTTTVLFAKYNLLVGQTVQFNPNGSPRYSITKTYSSNDEGYGLQNMNAQGYIHNENNEPFVNYVGVVGFSGTNYWDSIVCEYTGSIYGYCSGTDGLLPEYQIGGASYNSSPYPNIYNNSLSSVLPQVNTTNLYVEYGNYTIAYYVEQYALKLKEMGMIETANSRLLLYEEALSIKNAPDNVSSPNSYLYNTSFWLGSAKNYNTVYAILEDNHTSVLSTSYYEVLSLGVRPVIEIPTSVLS